MALPPSNDSSSFSLPPNSYSSKFHNPSRRSSEVNDPIRRSFSENPFTNAYTCPSPRRFGPSAPPKTSKDYPARRRDSISCPRECEEKENRTNPVSSKLHRRPRSVSPSTRTMIPPSASNSRKNFMSPTISTASKIGASPRKKILSESNNYNQPLQSPVTCSDLRSSSSSVRSLCGTFAEQMEADHKDYLAQRKERFSFSKKIEEKGNKRDLNSKQIEVKLQPASRNTKHFMSPTVSAVSKISASPRKKILTESSSDQISVGSSELRSSCSSVNNITGDSATKLHDPKGPVSKKNVTFDPTVHIISPVVSDPLQGNESVRGDELLDLESLFSSENNLSESMESSETKSERENGPSASYSDEVTCDSSFESENVEGEGAMNNVSPNLNSLSPVLLPLDVDQLIVKISCDPNTDSVAAEIADSCEGEIIHNPLDDGFVFDIFSDTTEGTIEVEFEKLQSEHDNLDSTEMMTTKPEQEKEIVWGKESLRQHFLTRPKWIFLVFIILCGFSLMTAINPQMRSYSMIKGSGFSMVSEDKVYGYLKGSVGSPGEPLRHWGNKIVSNLFGFISNIKVGDEWGYICFQNLTTSDGTWCLDKENIYHELTSDDSSYMLTNFEIFEQNNVQPEEELECEEIANETADESCVIEANVDQEVAGEAYESEGASDGISVEEENIQDEYGLYSAELNQMTTDPTSEKIEILQPAQLQPDLDQSDSNVGSESKSFTIVEEKLDDKTELDLAQTQVSMDAMVIDSMNGKAEPPHTSENEAETSKADDIFSVISESSDGSVVRSVLTISLLVISFAVTTTLVCERRKSSTKVATATEEQDQQMELHENLLDTSSMSAKLLVEISDVDEVSCSTAMSSYQKDDSLYRKCSKEAADEVQSQQRKKSKKSFRRESLASSSSDLSNSSLSSSYGSFTTYGMIPSRYRDGDEEMVVTPIRRSSRLRKH